MSERARQLAAALRERAPPGPVRILNVCGGHERTIAMAGLRQVLPDTIELIPGPGCPVCVCPEEDIRLAARIARETDAAVLTFGDMMRVPFHAPKREPRSLAQARAAGADIRPIASPLEALAAAQAEPGRRFVLFAVGFETTTAPVAAALSEGAGDNLLVLLSARRTAPAVRMLLERELRAFDALIAPGHVATVMGPEEWAFVPERFGIPAAIAGFTPDSMLAAIGAVLSQLAQSRPRLDNCYGAVVHPGGNRTARRLLEETFRIVDAPWRGIGAIAASGFALAEPLAHRDARAAFAPIAADVGPAPRQMPAGCECAGVVLGEVRPTDCPLYGKACTPRTPVGPCMVSDEGACRIWWAAGARGAKRAARIESDARAR